MRVYTLLIIFSVLAYSYATSVSLLEPIIENVVHLQTALPPPDVPGIWKKKMIWKARWVQEYKSEKKWRPVWRKVWSPVEIREWVPIPRPPPDLHEPEHSGPPHHSGNDLSSFSQGPHGPPAITGPPQGPPPFRPLPSGPSAPPNTYGLPSPHQRPQNLPKPLKSYGSPSSQNHSPSTPLLPVQDASPPEWPSPDMQGLLENYHTIRDPDAQNFIQQTPSSNYHVGSANPENPSLPNFFEPPRQQQLQQQQNNQLSRPPTNSSAPFRQDPRTSVSPYAAKLAQAVIRDKLNQSLNPTERPSGLTDVVFKTTQSSTTTAKSPTRISKAVGPSSSTDNPSNVYIVTPVTFG